MASLAESRTQHGVPLTLRLPAESVSSAVVLLHEYAERSPIPASESLIKLWKEKGSQFSASDCLHALETCVIATHLRADHFGEARSEMIPALIEKLGQGIPTLSRSDLVSASLVVEALRITAPSVQKQIQQRLEYLSSLVRGVRRGSSPLHGVWQSSGAHMKPSLLRPRNLLKRTVEHLRLSGSKISVYQREQLSTPPLGLSRSATRSAP